MSGIGSKLMLLGRAVAPKALPGRHRPSFSPIGHHAAGRAIIGRASSAFAGAPAPMMMEAAGTAACLECQEEKPPCRLLRSCPRLAARPQMLQMWLHARRLGHGRRRRLRRRGRAADDGPDLDLLISYANDDRQSVIGCQCIAEFDGEFLIKFPDGYTEWMDLQSDSELVTE